MDYAPDLLAHGVTVVTARNDGRAGGLAVAWATQVSAKRILICVGKQSTTRELISGSGAFTVSALRKDQVEVARKFGRGHSADVDKFEGIPHHAADSGAPVLDDCAAWFDCRVVDTFELDDGHLLFVGDIVAGEVREPVTDRLIYRQSDY
jgi:flavin reductase (DIM6/NTAB) family NADH-FMN oxidoreductase RutF